MATQSNRGRTQGLKENGAQRHSSKVGDATRPSRVGKRTVLGAITNHVRVQPSRAVKDGTLPREGNDENAGVPAKGKKGKNQPFSIFVDADPPPPKALAPERKPLATLQNQDVQILPDVLMGLPGGLQALPAIPDHRPGLLDMSIGGDDEDIDDAEMDLCAEQVLRTYDGQPASREATIEEMLEYTEDVYSYLLASEHRHRPRAGFMRRQDDVTLQMRCILIDWLVEVADEYRLQRETLFLTVEYIDRFLSLMRVQRPKLQLVGASAMFLASKYEEIYPPDVGEFVYITDDTYTKKQILKMEYMILSTLEFNVSTATTNWFVERLVRHANMEEIVKNFAMYLCEMVLVDVDQYLQFPNSKIAASAVCLALHTLRQPSCWPEICSHITRYQMKDLQPCLQMLQEQFVNAAFHPQQAVREKYKQPKYDRVAELNPNHQPFV